MNLLSNRGTESVVEQKPCRKCGRADRYTNGNCKPCNLQRLRDWREANPEKTKAGQQAYAEANREKIASRNKARREARPEENVARCRAYYAANRDKLVADKRAKYAACPQVHADRERTRRAAAGPEGRAARARTDRAYREANRTACAARQRKRSSGWTAEMFDTAWAAQSGRCPVCHVEMTRQGRGPDSVAADHCHQTGKPRGLLCRKCNTGNGMHADDPARLRAAAAYLEAHR